MPFTSDKVFAYVNEIPAGGSLKYEVRDGGVKGWYRIVKP
jgi:hypothetical protein